tara:strand:+ start:2216 stop:2701 length:486 start_codon:yes stop_codon:yes gene_type:complete
MRGKTTFRFNESDISDVKTLLDNKRLALSSMRFMTSETFILLPFETWRTLIDELPETKFYAIIQSLTKIINQFDDLETFLNLTKSWCIHAKKTPRKEHFFADVNLFNNKMEYTWHHNFGITNNNWSRIFFSSIIESELIKEWNTIDNNLNIGQLSITFEKK